MESKSTANLFAAVRSTIIAGRFLELKEAAKETDEQNTTGAIVLISDGQSTSVGGHGHIFDSFVETGRVTGFIGEGEQPISVLEDCYEASKLKIVRFDQTFLKLSYDASRRMSIELFSSCIFSSNCFHFTKCIFILSIYSR